MIKSVLVVVSILSGALIGLETLPKDQPSNNPSSVVAPASPVNSQPIVDSPAITNPVTAPVAVPTDAVPTPTPSTCIQEDQDNLGKHRRNLQDILDYESANAGNYGPYITNLEKYARNNIDIYLAKGCI